MEFLSPAFIIATSSAFVAFILYRASKAQPAKIQTKFTGTPRELESQVLTLIRNTKKIEALKLIHAATGLGLKESKEIVDKMSTGATLADSVALHINVVWPEGFREGVNDTALAEIDAYIHSGNKIEALKKVREVTHLGLKESNELTNKLIESAKSRQLLWLTKGADVGPSADHGPDQTANLDAVKDLIWRRQKIEAIKLYREQHGCGLKEAKEEIDRLSAELGQ
jgi:ribosomal protein L7/L12